MLLVGLVGSTTVGVLALVGRYVPGFGWLDGLLTGTPLALYLHIAAFVLVEGILPWLHDGSTPGGGFVRMSCETRGRTGARRLVFYAARLVVMGGAFLFFPFAWMVLALFYLVARRMPYDFV